MSPEVLQWTGAVLGALGALLLALRTTASRWGWVLFLASNGFWIAFGICIDAQGLVAMQLVFTATSVLGLWRWLFRPTPGA